MDDWDLTHNFYVILAFIAIAAALSFLVLNYGCSSSYEGQRARSNPTPAAASRPTAAPAPLVYAHELYREREENATRFDLNYKGRVVQVEGIVFKIDDGALHLVVSRFEIGSVSLLGVPVHDQAAINRGDTVRATCEVGDYVFGTMYMDNCTVTDIWIRE